VIFKIDFEKAYHKVRWDFVGEVLERKGFPDNWVNQTMYDVQGERVCINVNGERTQYFRTFQRLRQGGLYPPILFNLVVETLLAILMRKAVGQGKLKGVLTHLIPERITHIQYTDDTILMIEGDDASVVNMKFILYCFEWLSGLKISYHKSEAFCFGMEEAAKDKIANMLNCQLGHLPLKYLGIPINDGKLGKAAFVELFGKVSKRIPTWRGKHSSLRGRLVLTNKLLI
jgi:hypothetical protein